MADISVERSRYQAFQGTRVRAQKKASLNNVLGQRPRAFRVPQENQPPTTETSSLAASTSRYNPVQSFRLNQGRARLSQTRPNRNQPAAARQIRKAILVERLLGADRKKQRQLAEAKKASEETRRKLIRPAQASLFSGSVLGATTVIGLLFGGSAWVTWKGIELYKTATKADVGIFEEFVVPWNFRETLTFFMGAFFLMMVTLAVIGIIGLFIYFVLNPLEATKLLPLFREVFSFIF